MHLLPARVVRVLDRLRETMWLLPLVACTVSVSVAIVLGNLEAGGRDLPGITRDPDTARVLLSTAATTTITFAGLVFSITLLALQLTSSQFSPRALRQFLRAREGQAALAVFASSFVYDLVVLGRIGDEGFVPPLATTVGTALAVVSVGGFVAFVHHMTQAIRAVNILEAVAAEARECAARLDRGDDPPVAQVLAGRVRANTVSRPGTGAVLQVERLGPLAELAGRRGSILRSLVPVGEFVASGQPVLEEWVEPGDEPVDLTWSDVDTAFAFGPERTMNADLGFGFRQLVDIAEKALSPGVNDPTTAVQAIDRLTDLLVAEIGYGPAAGIRIAEDGGGIITEPVTFGGLAHLAFDEIRIYGAGDLQIVRRVLGALSTLDAAFAANDPDDQRAVVIDEIRGQYERAARRSIDDAEDLVSVGVVALDPGDTEESGEG